MLKTPKRAPVLKGLIITSGIWGLIIQITQNNHLNKRSTLKLQLNTEKNIYHLNTEIHIQGKQQ